MIRPICSTKARCFPTDVYKRQVLERTGRQPLANPLIDEGGAYRMDFEDLERKAADPQARCV